jgi:acyl homoserine lactone synthase
MSQLIKIAARNEFQSHELWKMYRLRAKVFKERMGWDVPILSGMEIDGYDALDPYYMLISDPDFEVRGCWRLLPTEGPYMLRDTFPELLHGNPAPESHTIWELSRFAIATDGPSGFGFAELVLESMREIASFGDRMGIDCYVTVTTTSIERLLRRTGIAITRFGPPIRIGVENSVALNIDLGQQTHAALFGEISQA